MKIFQKLKKLKKIKKLHAVEKIDPVDADVANNDSENTKPFKLDRQILVDYMDKNNQK
ncbi:hypothetical protein [Clostridium estertheticum]|uniref:Uncharacterized protein n=1 Tax=Clostridium estertheticum TaxID=238834 RepID=A0A7Y3WQR0_9CLOT|nr:hypothetical protein [Clostridium estertheticum]MBW9172604.1 hypothetical protein [Clostridium estertheticum]NNU75162.1 hypothetical protein [Clostridium estertheticum]WBL48365.1 hypothetical protein LOR37_06820 [Clostridium estertheticum]WLC76444.1 hypothetical protein KTC99_06450 [Clostridium estertheticum]